MTRVLCYITGTIRMRDDRLVLLIKICQLQFHFLVLRTIATLFHWIQTKGVEKARVYVQERAAANGGEECLNANNTEGIANLICNNTSF